MEANMKKLIPLLSLTFLIGLFSSCILALDTSRLGNNSSKPKTRFDITCRNNTSVKVTDWFVQDDDKHNYYNSEDECHISPGSYDTITGLSKDYYKVFLTFEVKEQLQETDYESSNFIYLDEDVTFDIARRGFYRAASTAESDSEEGFVLICSNGKEYPLVKADSEK